MYPVYVYLKTETKCEEVPVAFPPQQQDRQPGMEAVMQSRPISENACAAGGGRLCDRVALITGGDSGIGRAVAYAFAKEGADVEELGRRCLLLPGDLRDPACCRAAVERTVGCYGKLNVLVNNHAVQFIRRSILDITREQLLATFETNILSYFYLIQAALPHLGRGSSIINTTSVTAYAGEPLLIDYSATKGAVMALTRSLSLSLEGQGVRVNAVAPGPIWTPLIPASYSAREVQTFGTDTSRVPMLRAGQPFEVASSYVFLASDDASYMSGQVLHPNGGKIVGS